MNTETIDLTLVGERPILMHSAILVDPLEPVTQELARLTKKRGKTIADHQEIARVEWMGGMWTVDGRPCIPASAIKAVFVEAARTRRKGKHAEAGFACNGSPLLQYNGPVGIDELWQDKQFRLRVPVTVNGGSRTMRTRPRFPVWRVHLEVEFVPGLLDRAEVIEIFQIGGFRFGLGDGRPDYGRFSVKLE
jgi:hypothetical protein